MKARRIRLCIESELSNVSLIGATVQQLCTIAPMSEVDAYQVQLAIVEAVNNIIKHAYELAPNREVHVEISMYPDRLIFKLIDTGRPIPNSAKPELDFDPENLDSVPESGMGLFIIHSVMDDIDYTVSDNRNVQTFVKYLNTPEKN